MEEWTITADLASLPGALDRVAAALQRLGAPAKAVQEVELAVDEAVTNIILHGYESAGGRIALSCEKTEEGVVVEIRDAAPAFDPTAASAPDLEGGADERPIGGLGVHLMRKMTDAVMYERRQGENVLRLVKHFER
ncbi:ATP-binding protein [Methanofollis sp. UBA420]|uniref:ATP-binding protein n=1 Tax=Methanofollis sp. UBA420 TaxID=1915514 RepID=UPI00316ABFCF